MLTSHEKDVLRIFAGLKAATGQPVPVKTVFVNWSLRGAYLADALESLAAAGKLTGNEKQTEFALTEAGAAEIAAWR